jgi:hypothetical protein
MYRWITIMAGGPQDGERIRRDFYAPRAHPAIRADDGKMCCPVAMHVELTHAVCVVVHPDACDAQVERAVDTMMGADASAADRV